MAMSSGSREKEVESKPFKREEEMESQAMKCIMDGKYKDAESMFDYLLLRPSPPTVDAATAAAKRCEYYVSRAQLKIRRDRFRGAIDDADEALRIDSKFEKAYFCKSAAYLELKEYESAKKALENVSDGPKKEKLTKKIAESQGIVEIIAAANPPPTFTQTDISQKFLTIVFTEGQDAFKFIADLAVQNQVQLVVLGGYGSVSKAVLEDKEFLGNYEVVCAQGWVAKTGSFGITLSICSADDDDGVARGGLARQGTLAGKDGLRISVLVSAAEGVVRP